MPTCWCTDRLTKKGMKVNEYFDVFIHVRNCTIVSCMHFIGIQPTGTLKAPAKVYDRCTLATCI